MTEHTQAQLFQRGTRFSADTKKYTQIKIYTIERDKKRVHAHTST